jgi:hypothetical protein
VFLFDRGKNNLIGPLRFQLLKSGNDPSAFTS